jgi:Rieske 2Fe-2S family protein
MIAGPGQYVLFEVGPDNLIVLRDRSGTVRALHNTCRHRGTRLCDAPCGELSETIQCPYHAWTYGLDGRLLGVPDAKEMEDFDKADYPLKQAAVAVWEGFVFVNLAEEPEPFAEAYAPLISRLGRWNLGRARSAAHRHDAGHWKILFQNYWSATARRCTFADKLSPHERRERPRTARSSAAS